MARRLSFIEKKKGEIQKEIPVTEENFPKVVLKPTKKQVEEALKEAGIKPGQALTEEQYNLYKEKLKEQMKLKKELPETEEELITRAVARRMYENRILEGRMENRKVTREEAKNFINIFLGKEGVEKFWEQNPDLKRRYDKAIEKARWTPEKALKELTKAEYELEEMPRVYKAYKEVTEKNPNIEKKDLIIQLALKGIDAREIRKIIDDENLRKEYQKAYEEAEKRKARRKRIEQEQAENQIGQTRAKWIQEYLRKGYPLKEALEKADEKIKEEQQKRER